MNVQALNENIRQTKRHGALICILAVEWVVIVAMAILVSALKL